MEVVGFWLWVMVGIVVACLGLLLLPLLLDTSKEEESFDPAAPGPSQFYAVAQGGHSMPYSMAYGPDVSYSTPVQPDAWSNSQNQVPAGTHAFSAAIPDQTLTGTMV